MPTSTTVNDLKINKLTSAQYDAAVQGGVIGENELSIITDLDEAIQVSSLPTAGASEEGKIYQYIGATDANYTNGYFYKCVGAGSPVVYSWTQVNVQPAPSGLPDQTGQSGKFLTTDGTDASWATINALTNNSSASYSLAVGTNSYAPSGNCTCVGYGASSGNGMTEAVAVGASSVSYTQGVAVGSRSQSTTNSVAIGKSALACMGGGVGSSDFAIAIGYQAVADGKGVIQLGRGTNNTANTFKVANTTGNYEIMSVDGTIPTDRFTTTPSVAGTYSATITVDGQGAVTRSWATAPDPLPSQTGNAGKVLSTNGTTASWVDISTSPSTMPQLLAANWSSNTQTVSVTGVTANNVVMVSPSPVSATEYAQCGILCTAQAAGTLTFTCTSVPTNDLTVNVVCF